MPGHALKEEQVKNKSLFAKYRCHSCSLVLRDAVQPLCGHWLCESCIQPLIKRPGAVCPRSDCHEPLMDEDCNEDGSYFPDNFVRREIKNLHILCKWSENCTWEGKLKDYDEHLKVCKFVVQECSKCGRVMDDNHQCPKELFCSCPLVSLGCKHKQTMTQENFHSHSEQDFKILAETILELKSEHKVLTMSSNVYSAPQPPTKHHAVDDNGYDSGRLHSFISSNSVWPSSVSTKRIPSGLTPLGVGDVEKGSICTEISCKWSQNGCTWKGMLNDYDDHLRVCEFSVPQFFTWGTLMDGKQCPEGLSCSSPTLLGCECKKIFGTYGECNESPSLGCGDVMIPKEEASNFIAKAEMVINENMSKTETAAQIHEVKVMLMDLKRRITKLEMKQEQPSGVLKCNMVMGCSHNGQLYWKIPDINQRLKDAHRGETPSLYSCPFYTSSNGYKICLRLNLLGEGTGKCTHLSLFLVVMHGEFDDVLKWPFDSKVTFILINPSGGCNIVDMFWPDPSCSSFRKPKSDMNIAFGCPQFLPQLDLMKFVLNGSIEIQCIVGTNESVKKN